MILAIFESISHAETLLNNLSEADFDLNEVSVITNDEKLRDAIATDTGPLKGVQPKKIIEALTRIGVEEGSAQVCGEAISNGKVLLVMNVADEFRQAAEEMFTDHSAQLVKG